MCEDQMSNSRVRWTESRNLRSRRWLLSKVRVELENIPGLYSISCGEPMQDLHQTREHVATEDGERRKMSGTYTEDTVDARMWVKQTVISFQRACSRPQVRYRARQTSPHQTRYSAPCILITDGTNYVLKRVDTKHRGRRSKKCVDGSRDRVRCGDRAASPLLALRRRPPRRTDESGTA
ncbi:hypothetical protein K466DRAFT_215203 [Polyporus arcularius HHB13444]|uniref:Uncharacterized protein n=1 Tax=Polyporus arcularius HHB13444 TaxID=1314778 RepID=A0A5C3P6W9_9APHY|nr:hypothetical protein K466DRAFT_215203 [Polyporus arcularius HHB13444]